MSKPLIPHADQEKAIEHIVANPRTLLKAPTGAGKTLVGTEAFLRSEAKVLLIVAPLNTFKGWKATLAGQTQGVMELRRINSRKAGQEALNDALTGVPGAYHIGWEYFRGLGWNHARVDFVIADECHRATNRKSKAHTVLKSLPRDIAMLMMSATPFGNKTEGCWALARVLWPAQTAKSFWTWLGDWMITEKDPYSYIKATFEKNPGALWDSLPSAIKMKSVYTAEPVIHEVEVALLPIQRKHYKELEEEAITWLEDNPLAPELPGVMYLRLLQVTLAVPSIKQGWVRKYDKDMEEWVTEWGDIVYFKDDAKSTKADAVQEILSDLSAGGETPPVMIYTHSMQFATLLAKRLQSKGYRARQFIGGMPTDEREWKLEQFGKQFEIMVATIPAIAEGADGLQLVCSNEIWVSHSDNNLLNVQTRGRLSRQGQTETVNRWVIGAEQTIETENKLVKKDEVKLSQRDRLKLGEEILEGSLGK